MSFRRDRRKPPGYLGQVGAAVPELAVQKLDQIIARGDSGGDSWRRSSCRCRRRSWPTWRRRHV